MPEGLIFHSFLLPYVTPNNLCSFEISSIQQKLKEDCCAESHIEFLAKCSNPLWTQSEFFISLPFKKNEDINPTKASHVGMNPEHLILATQEIQQLQAQGLIEPTTSSSACEAFYVNKRSEQSRGKMRLVVNYKPLNYFLADDKFPLPTSTSLFQHLAHAKIFSKFDLKAGFWQLGIVPEDRPKQLFAYLVSISNGK